MKRFTVMHFCGLLSVLILTSACAPKTSVDRHARQYVYASDDGFDPNFYVNKDDSARKLAPLFQQFREKGVKDRAAGVSPELAQKAVVEFRSEAFLKSIQRTTTFAGRAYNDSQPLSPKTLKALGDAIADTYLDGYMGRP